MELTPNQVRFMDDFILFANNVWPIWTWAYDIKTRRPYDSPHIQSLMLQAGFHEGRDLRREIQPSLTSWNRLTAPEKRDIGAIFGKQVNP